MNQPTKPPSEVDLLAFQRVGFYMDKDGRAVPVDEAEADKWSRFVNEWMARINRSPVPR
jgi:hypothetical protein